MTFQLRPYQTDMIDRARASLRRHQSIILQAPTGAGKTALSAAMIGTAHSRGIRSYFVCHRVELVQQTSKMFKTVGIPHGFCVSGMPFHPDAGVMICSIDTLKVRLDRVHQPGLVVWDEAHHVAAAGWRKVRSHFDKAKHIGLTATPERLDGKGLNDLFEDLVLGPSVRWLIDNKYLSDYRAYAPPKLADLSNVSILAGDYDQSKLAAVMSESTITGQAVAEYQRQMPGKQAIVFCVTVEHSEQVADQFRAAGIRAASLDGTTHPIKRQNVIEAFAAGRVQVLCNVNLFGEGFDVPAIEGVILLRPTQSLGLHLQQLGRSLRPAPGKTHAIILDHAGNIGRHGLPDEEREWSLEGRSKKKKETKQEERVKQCPQCLAIHEPAPSCPYCGFVYPVRSIMPEQVEGNLVELDKEAIRRAKEEKRKADMREQAQARSVEALIELGRARGYKWPERWAANLWAARANRRGGRGMR